MALPDFVEAQGVVGYGDSCLNAIHNSDSPRDVAQMMMDADTLAQQAKKESRSRDRFDPQFIKYIMLSGLFESISNAALLRLQFLQGEMSSDSYEMQWMVARMSVQQSAELVNNPTPGAG